jgi:SpoVK/Ycf46/Vps4 family AAA+-type ATPase
MDRDYLIAKVKAFFEMLIEAKQLWNSLLITAGFLTLSFLFPIFDFSMPSSLFVLLIGAAVIFVASWHSPVAGTILSYVALLPGISYQVPVFGWIFILMISFMLFEVFERWYIFASFLVILGITYASPINLFLGPFLPAILAFSVFRLGSRRAAFFLPICFYLVLIFGALFFEEVKSSSFLVLSEKYESGFNPRAAVGGSGLEAFSLVIAGLSKLFSWEVLSEAGRAFDLLVKSTLTLFFDDVGLVQIIVYTIIYYCIAWLPVIFKESKFSQTIPSLFVAVVPAAYALFASVAGQSFDLMVIPICALTICIAYLCDVWKIKITKEEEIVAEEKRGLFGLPGLVDLSVAAGPSSLDEVGNYGETKKEIKESILMPLKYRETQIVYGIRPPKGILLFGPPGCGKTLLMSALAKELKIPFYYVKCSEILSAWYGESERNISELFANARKNQPCILFIDEIDAIGKKRELYISDETTPRVLSALLQEMDGLKEKDSIIVVGATNVPHLLDRALLRPGRFDKIIYMPAPDEKGRKEILELYLKKLPKEKIDLELLAKRTERFTGADLANLVTEAARKAASEAKGKIVPIRTSHFLELLDVIKPSLTYEMLEEYERFRTDFERRGVRVAHEITEEIKIKFDDIADLEDVKRTLKEAIELPLFHEEELKKLKVRPAKGILMFGPPGCGKTMLAKAASNELKATFIYITPADISRVGYAKAAQLIRETFYRAKENAPSIIFIDEIDAIAPDRAFYPANEEIVAQLLQEIDGLKDLKNVILVGATNRPEIIDKALLRPGRFDKLVFVSTPDEEGRKEIFRKNLEGLKGAERIDYDVLAQKSEGFSGADISAICQEIKLDYLRKKIRGKEEEITTDDVLQYIYQRTPSVTIAMLKGYLKFVKEFGERR